MMPSKGSAWLGLFVWMIVLVSAAGAADAPANVAGTWAVSASGGGGTTISQTLVIQQDGSKITGTFKGPRQSGTLEGTVTGNAVTFHVQARLPLDYTGTASGDTMKGTISEGGKSGSWTATRSK